MTNVNKISRDIQIAKIKVGKIIFEPNDLSVGWIGRLILSNLKKLSKFYKTNCPEMSFELVYSREEFNNKVGRQTPEWMAGVVLKNKIYLFSPLVIEKVSTHKKSKLNEIITHELCHIFNNKINKEILTWIDEGIALFLANQKKLKDFKKSDWRFFVDSFLNKNIDLQDFAKYEGYKISYWTIRTIADTFGVNKLLDLIKINPKQENVEKKLEKTLGIPVEDFLKLYCNLVSTTKTQRK